MPVNVPTIEHVRATLIGSGLEVFRVEVHTIHLAQRVRSHLMDAGVRVRCEGELAVELTVRAQRSDFPADSTDALFARVRSAIGELAREHGFDERDARPRDVRDPVDQSRLLDVWHELTFAKQLAAADSLIEDVRWALRVPKCVSS